MSSRERRRWVIARVVAKARRERFTRERSSSEPPMEPSARRKQSEEPGSK